MSELTNLALLFCMRATDKGLKREEVLWLIDCQLDHLENVEELRRLDGLFLKGGCAE